MLFMFLILISNLSYSMRTNNSKDSEMNMMENIESVYSFVGDAPSCQISLMRQLERDKKLRELFQLKDLTDFNSTLLRSRLFLSRFIDTSLYEDEVVHVVNHWRVDEEFIFSFQNQPEALCIKIKGVGIEWSERLARFPEEVYFYLDENKKILTTRHLAFHSDFCSDDQVVNQILWTKALDGNEFSSEELIDLLRPKTSVNKQMH